jgi:hypothetical protein
MLAPAAPGSRPPGPYSRRTHQHPQLLDLAQQRAAEGRRPGKAGAAERADALDTDKKARDPCYAARKDRRR